MRDAPDVASQVMANPAVAEQAVQRANEEA